MFTFPRKWNRWRPLLIYFYEVVELDRYIVERRNTAPSPNGNLLRAWVIMCARDIAAGFDIRRKWEAPFLNEIKKRLTRMLFKHL